MEASWFNLFGIAGIGGIAFASVVYVFREIIRKSIFPQLSKNQAYSFLNKIVILIFILGVLGILAYALSASLNNRDKRDTSINTVNSSRKNWTVRVYNFSSFEISPIKDQMGKRLSGRVLDYLLEKNLHAKKGIWGDYHSRGAKIRTPHYGRDAIDSVKHSTPYAVVYGIIHEETQKDEKLELHLQVLAFRTDKFQEIVGPSQIFFKSYNITNESEKLEEIAQTIGDDLIRLIECYPPDKKVEKYHEKCKS